MNSPEPSSAKCDSPEHYPYYHCQNSACVEHGKSIRRADLEGAFVDLLRTLRPVKNLFTLAKAMLQDAWAQRQAHAGELRLSVKREAAKTQRQIDQLMKRVVETTNPTIVSAYEKKLAQLEENRLLWAERQAQTGKPIRGFNEMFEHAHTTRLSFFQVSKRSRWQVRFRGCF
jgi:site-specific DNA recombinase